ncbi:MAG: prolyl oligopeptidase family serine peptidase [Calditrichaceae bacterium]
MKLFIGLLTIMFSFLLVMAQDDPYLWLEDVEGDSAMAWVLEQNKITVDAMQAHPDFEKIKKNILDVLNSKERIAYPTIHGKYVTNYWQDEKNERGLWRRTTLENYLQDSVQWETLLDFDALSTQEGEKWAYGGVAYLYPDTSLCMIQLSRGGSDAVVMREFDLRAKDFVKGGFNVPEAKSSVDWIDKDHLIISTDFGEGSLTTSGYPRIAKIWERGTPLNEAKTLYEGRDSDVAVWVYVVNTPERAYTIVHRSITFYTYEMFVLLDDKLVKLDLQEDAQLDGFFKNQMLVEIKTDWSVSGTTYKQGSLISIDFDKFISGNRDFSVIYEPDDRSSLSSVSNTKNFLLLNKITNVKSELVKCSLEGGQWKKEKVKAPDFGSIGVRTTDDFSDQFFFTFTNYLEPSSLYYVSEDQTITKLKSLPQFFDSDKFEVEQYEAESKDGTMIPYFIVFAKDMKQDGSNPTLLYGYGGFEISMRPRYSATIGNSWLEMGGVYVVANIRGGGEFGPKWHQAALKEHRQRAYDDFYAVAEDLIDRKITSPKHLGIMGGSNGGLLVGVAFTQRPDLFNAVVCSAPLLDMRRYNKMLAGASWMGEYGNPDVPEEWAYISKYSPYQNLDKTKKYPKVLFTTTTRDDRVHPGHARKMSAKMTAMGIDNFYFENTEGGHGAGVTNEQRAFMTAIEFTYLHKMLDNK